MDTKTFALHLKWRRSSPYYYFHIQIQTRKLFIISRPSSLWSALYSKLGTPSSCLELKHKAYSSLTTCTWKQRPIPWGKAVSYPSTYSIKCACSGKSHMEGSINYLLATPLEDDNEDPLYLCFNLHCTILESLWEFSTTRANEFLSLSWVQSNWLIYSTRSGLHDNILWYTTNSTHHWAESITLGKSPFKLIYNLSLSQVIHRAAC